MNSLYSRLHRFRDLACRFQTLSLAPSLIVSGSGYGISRRFPGYSTHPVPRRAGQLRDAARAATMACRARRRRRGYAATSGVDITPSRSYRLPGAQHGLACSRAGEPHAHHRTEERYRVADVRSLCAGLGAMKPAQVIPTRSIETWLHCLDGHTVNETDRYPPLKRPGDCKTHVRALVEMCTARGVREPAPRRWPPPAKSTGGSCLDFRLAQRGPQSRQQGSSSVPEVGRRQTAAPSRAAEFYPESFGMYHEPFLGSGAVFFDLAGRLANGRVRLTDVNADLVGCWLLLRDDPDAVVEGLHRLAAGYRGAPADHFYRIRNEEFNPARKKIMNGTGLRGRGVHAGLGGHVHLPEPHRLQRSLPPQFERTVQRSPRQVQKPANLRRGQPPAGVVDTVEAVRADRACLVRHRAAERRTRGTSSTSIRRTPR